MANDDLDLMTDEERRRRALAIGATSQPSFPLGSSETSLEAPELTGLKPIASASLPLPLEHPAKPTAPAGSLQDTQNQLAELQWKRENPWGSAENHPGILGKIGHVAAKIGNVAGDVLAPDVMARVPGTDLNRELRENELTTRLGQQQREASEEGLRNVQEQNLQSEIDARKNPKPKLLSGEENIAVGPDGKRYQRYELPDQSTTWVEEGATPSLRTIGPSASGTEGLPTIAAPAPVTAPAAAGGLPAGATVGKPKTESSEDKFIAQYLKDNKLEDTAENREKGRAAYTSGGPIGADQATQISSQIQNVLKGSGLDPKGYTVTEKSTRAEANEALKAAQTAATEARNRNKPEEAESRKDRQTMGYALDENGNLKYMSKADANKLHSTFEEMKSGDVNKDRQALRQLNDVQMNTSRYRKAVDALPEAISRNHALLMEQIVGDQKINAGLTGSLIPGADYILNTLKGTSVADQWNTLSKQEREVVIGYLRAKGSVIAYQKALSGIGRTNKEQLDIEMANLPLPMVGATVADQQMEAWQENVDRAADGFPRNLPGIKHPSDLRRELEGGGGAQGGAPPAGAKVRNYNPTTGTLE